MRRQFKVYAVHKVTKLRYLQSVHNNRRSAKEFIKTMKMEAARVEGTRGNWTRNYFFVIRVNKIAPPKIQLLPEEGPRR